MLCTGASSYLGIDKQTALGKSNKLGFQLKEFKAPLM